MKFFTYIFGIYILALSIMPCSDVYNVSKSNAEVTISENSHEHKTDHNDRCSPFCTCACCSIAANPKFAAFKIHIEKSIVTSKITFPRRDFSFVSNYFGSIWQPPKIG